MTEHTNEKTNITARNKDGAGRWPLAVDYGKQPLDPVETMTDREYRDAVDRENEGDEKNGRARNIIADRESLTAPEIKVMGSPRPSPIKREGE